MPSLASRITLASMLCAFSLRVFAADTPASAPLFTQLNDEQKKQLSNSEVLVRQVPNPGKNGATYEALGLIPASIDRVAAILVDFEKYPEFMPNVSRVTVTQNADKTIDADNTLSLPLGKKKEYRLRFWQERSAATYRLLWKILPRPDLAPLETIVDTTGYWQLENVPQKKDQILALYHVYTDPGHIPWGLGWIADILTERSVPGVVTATRNRAKSQEELRKDPNASGAVHPETPKQK
jgi:hypothetical protein